MRVDFGLSGGSLLLAVYPTGEVYTAKFSAWWDSLTEGSPNPNAIKYFGVVSVGSLCCLCGVVMLSPWGCCAVMKSLNSAAVKNVADVYWTAKLRWSVSLGCDRFWCIAVDDGPYCQKGNRNHLQLPSCGRSCTHLFHWSGMAFFHSF